MYVVGIVPWFVVGIVISYFLDQRLDATWLKRFSGKLRFDGLVASQMAGMMSPLSIMSGLPIARELANKGVNPGLLLSFFIAERAYDLQSFFIIRGLFGLRFAVLNAVAILVSLVVAALCIRNDVVRFKGGRRKKKSTGTGFWVRQARMMLLVLGGIVFGAAIRSFVPTDMVSELAGGYVRGLVSAVGLGFALYLGPVVGNYPVAKALADLGMAEVGSLAFLTVSPIFNVIILALFGAAVGFGNLVKPVSVYVGCALGLTVVFGLWL